MITITHTLPEGTLVDGTSRGDGSREVLNRYRFRWSRNLGQWYIPKSRDRIANRYRIDQAADALRVAGFEVEVSIDNSAQDAAEREERRDERAGDRADALAAKADRKGAEASAAYGREHAILDVIPMGQPILVGHHSERRHRSDLAKAESARRRGSEAAAEAESAAERSTAALRGRERRHTPDYLANRIHEREAEERLFLRRLADKDRTLAQLAAKRAEFEEAGGRGVELAEEIDRLARYEDYYADCEARLVQVRADLEYFRGELAALEDSGVKVWKQSDFKPGDMAQVWGSWCKVRRANPKTLSVDSGYSWANRVRYTEVKAKMTAAEWAAATGSEAA